MFKKILFILFSAFFFFSAAIADVNVNMADESALQSLKGIGPAKAQAIISEREANGPFKDAIDLSKRVKGIGAKSVTKLQDEGMIFEVAKVESKQSDSAKANENKSEGKTNSK